MRQSKRTEKGTVLAGICTSFQFVSKRSFWRLLSTGRFAAEAVVGFDAADDSCRLNADLAVRDMPSPNGPFGLP
jgi:hypothetical protein